MEEIDDTSSNPQADDHLPVAGEPDDDNIAQQNSLTADDDDEPDEEPLNPDDDDDEPSGSGQPINPA